jgi:hypothetical protein
MKLFRLGKDIRRIIKRIYFVFDFILYFVYVVDACALSTILPSLSLIDYLHAAEKSDASIGVHVEINIDFASPYRLQTWSKQQ